MHHKRLQVFAGVTFIVLGIVLLRVPQEWFPDFYRASYIGVIALLSSVLIYLPSLMLTQDTPKKRELVLQSRSVIAFSLSINLLGELGLFQLYRFGFEYDKFAHFIVCMAFTVILCEALIEWKHCHSKQAIIVAVLIIVGSGILWEVVEFSSDVLFGTQEWGVYGKYTVPDTIKDILFNIVGIISGIIIFKPPKRLSK
ncbi:MAG: DUF2238 domain-containing protein [Candidatus Moranbacteria bacterium]|nr:DUF2238 domain-containing protein [Candidatus Moranbacteria bacterium]